MKKQKWIKWGAVLGICAAIAGVSALVVMDILGREPDQKVEIADLGEMEQLRIKGAVDALLQFNLPEVTNAAYDGAKMREGSYEENEAGGIYQAIFVVDLPNVAQSYRVNYYYLTEEQEKYFAYTTLASCLPVEELIFPDFDCRGDQMTVFIDTWHEVASQLTIEFGIPWEAVMAQGILESASGTSYYATERNNFFGIAAFDSNPDMAYTFATPEAGWRGYFENIVRTPVYCQAGIFGGESVTDPLVYLQTVKAAGYATDPDYVKSTSEVLRSVIARRDKKGWESSSELAERYPEMLANAARFRANCR